MKRNDYRARLLALKLSRGDRVFLGQGIESSMRLAQSMWGNPLREARGRRYIPEVDGIVDVLNDLYRFIDGEGEGHDLFDDDLHVTDDEVVAADAVTLDQVARQAAFDASACLDVLSPLLKAVRLLTDAQQRALLSAWDSLSLRNRVAYVRQQALNGSEETLQDLRGRTVNGVFLMLVAFDAWGGAAAART